MRLTAKQVTWLKVSLHLAGLLPLSGWSGRSITARCRSGEREIQHFTGRTALVFAGDLVNHTSGTLRKTAVIDSVTAAC